MTIARNRWRAHLKRRGDDSHAVARTHEELHGEWPEVGYPAPWTRDALTGDPRRDRGR
jgi:hypothetical protein